MRINLFGKKKVVSEEEELRNQVENYHSLKITKSARGLAVIVMSIFLLITWTLYYFDAVPAETFWGSLLYIIFAFFIYKGHRWAIIVTMLMWTLDKGYQVFEGEASVIALFFWWIVLISPLYSALEVENARRKKSKEQAIDSRVVPVTAVNSVGDGAIFCTACGTRLQTGASFCQDCGNKVI